MLSRFLDGRRRRGAVRDMERRLAELDRLDREHGLGTMPSAVSSRSTRQRRSSGAALPGLLVTGAVLAGVVAFSPSAEFEDVRQLLGLSPDRSASAPVVVEGSGPYSFVQTQSFSDDPVGYNPCRPIEVVVNPQGAPDGYDELVDVGLAHVSAATGLTFQRVGLTDDRDVRSSGARRPVLVMWATAKEVPDLAGEVAGIGGSVAVTHGSTRRYVTGRVVLDRDVFAAFGARDRASAQAIVDHELAHVVGLGHVDDPGELMNEENLGVTAFGPGDREGLARLGNVPC